MLTMQVMKRCMVVHFRQVGVIGIKNILVQNCRITWNPFLSNLSLAMLCSFAPEDEVFST